MKILISGSNGFLGSYLTRKLTEKSHELHPFSRKACFTSFLNNNYEYDLLIHVAAATPSNSPEEYIMSSNLDVASKLAFAARKFNINKIINISSMSIYGDISSLIVNEKTESSNLTSYGLSKYLSELLFDKMLLNSAKVWHLRLPGVVGVGGYNASANFISSVAESLSFGRTINLHSPNTKFNNIISDRTVLETIEFLINSDLSSGQFLLGSKNPQNLSNVINYLFESFNSKSKINWQDPPDNYIPFYLDINKAITLGIPLYDTIDECDYLAEMLNYK